MVMDDLEFHWVQLALERRRRSAPSVAVVRPDRRLDAATEDSSCAAAAMPNCCCCSGYPGSVFCGRAGRAEQMRQRLVKLSDSERGEVARAHTECAHHKFRMENERMVHIEWMELGLSGPPRKAVIISNILCVCSIGIGIWNGQTNIADRDDRADASIGLSTGGYFAGGIYGIRSLCSLQYGHNNSFVVFNG